MLNHVSIRSGEFGIYGKRRCFSYRDMFIHWEEFWPEGNPTEGQYQACTAEKLYIHTLNYKKGRENRSLVEHLFEEQIDINPMQKPRRITMPEI